MWIVNFEGIVVDWEIAQRRVALGERATLTGAGNDGLSTKKYIAIMWLTTSVGTLAPTH